LQEDRRIFLGKGTGFSRGNTGGLTHFFNMNHLKAFDSVDIFKPITEKITANAQEIASGTGIEYIEVPERLARSTG
jgi:hypothetical protein